MATPDDHPAEAIEALAKSAGFALDEALDRIGHSTTIYCAMGRLFLEMQDKILANLGTALASTAYDEAAHQLHTLRGSALSLGATELSSVAKAAEHRLTQLPPPDADERNEMLERLQASLALAHAELTRILAHFEQHETTGSPS